jgi:hypothetical protein
MIDPNPFIAPGVTLGQWAYNTRVVGRALASYPPYLYGYNPYPQVVNYGPVYRTPTPMYVGNAWWRTPGYPPYSLYPYAGYTPYSPYLNAGYALPNNYYVNPYPLSPNPYAGYVPY